MRRPSLGQLLFVALSLGVGSGAVEVALRASPRLGLEPGELGLWLAFSMGLSSAFLAVVAVVAWAIGRRPFGVVLGSLVLVHGAIAYRFEVVLNEYLSSPKVWAGLLLIGLVSVAVGIFLDRLVERHRVVVALVALVAGAVGFSVALQRSEPVPAQVRTDQPNVVVITIDTLRADVLGPYGSDNATPNIDRLAAEGVVFESVVAAAPTTEPAHLAIFTGQPPYQSGVVANGTRLGDRPELIWRALDDRGYTTGGFVAGFPLHSRFGWAQGMDVYDDDFGRIRGLHLLSLVKAWDQVVLPAHTLRERPGRQVMDRATAWVRRHKGEPFFLWVHLFDPHAPYEAPGHRFDPPTDGEPLELPFYWPDDHKEITSTEWLTEAYRAEVRHTDALVGELLDSLQSAGVLDQTAVVLTADHGESLTEHSYLFDHGDNLYDPSLLIPLVVRWPGVARAGHRVPCQVSNTDVAPTLLDLLQLSDAPDQAVLERAGRVLSDAVRGHACSDAPVVSSTVSARFVEQPPVDHSWRMPEDKLIRTGQDGSNSCFDLQADPGELRPGACEPLMVSALDATLAGGKDATAPEQDRTTNAALEALGYIDAEEDEPVPAPVQED